MRTRAHSHNKIPVLFVVGAKEAEQGSVAIRRLGSEANNVTPLAQAIADLQVEALPSA